MSKTANSIGYTNIEGGQASFSGTQLRFRPLRADEVDVRVAEAKDGRKATLILYQDARCAMNILDATLGPTAWQREYYEAAGLLFCKIGIFDFDTNQWLWKSDTGSKSNIEEDKGLASDAFKRAAVAWGIGRELYTAPRISIDINEKDVLNGKVCQTFNVGEMEVIEGVITKLTIIDKSGKTRYTFPSSVSTESPKASPSFSTTSYAPTRSKNDNEEALYAFCEKKKETVTEEEREELDRFYRYFMKPDKDDPSQSKIAKWQHLNLDALWKRWLENKLKYNK